MNITITGKDLKATEAIKDYIEKKIERLEKYFDTDEYTSNDLQCHHIFPNSSNIQSWNPCTKRTRS